MSLTKAPHLGDARDICPVDDVCKNLPLVTDDLIEQVDAAVFAWH